MVSLAAIAAINARLTATHTRDRIERQLQGVSKVLASSNFPLTDSVLRRMRELSSAEFIVTDGRGRPRASSLASPPAELPIEAAAGGNLVEALEAPLEIAGARYLHRITKLPASVPGGDRQLLHLLFPESEYRRSWREAFLPPLVVGAIAVASVVIVARILAARISRATAKLSSEVLRMARGDFASIELPATNDELRDLSVAVNRTAELLTDYEQHVRQTEQMRTVALLGAGLAHEMRNAATGCRMALDLHATQCNGKGHDESLSVAKRQLRLMESQLQRFLRAGKADSSAARDQISLGALVDEVLPLIAPAARHAGIDLKWTSPPHDVLVTGDRESLGQALTNLLINAIEAAQQTDQLAERRVTVELNGCDSNRAELIVADNGRGPAAATSTSLFNPFVTSKPEGVGLGLAVAQQIVQSHGGSIEWSRAEGVTRFSLALPRTSEISSSV